MKDSDNDDVTDYLDVKPKSPSGLVVNTKQNSSPDHYKNFVDRRIQDIASHNKPNSNATDTSNNNELVRELVNDGYVTAYFDFGKSNLLMFLLEVSIL